jgi:hypothetical protein
MDPDQELEGNREYQRILAGLSPDERLRLLGADFDLQRQLNKKRDYRRAISDLPPGKKLALLEELRNRAQLLQGRRRSPSLNSQPTAKDSIPSPPTKSPQGGRRSSRSPRANGPARRFGGRGTAGGVNYEVRIAAFIAVKMLAGSKCSVWNGISGADVSAITMQAPEPVDDIVVNLRGDAEARVFISAKERSATISLTAKGRAFADTVEAFVRQFLELSPAARMKSRFLWAVPSSAGLAATRNLVYALDALRMDAGDTSLSTFMCGRQPKEAKALKALLDAAGCAWKRQPGQSPTDNELRSFVREVHVQIYDFGYGQRHEIQAESEIRSHIVADPNDAQRVWEKLEHFFARVDQRGVRVTSGSLRQTLVADGIALQSQPDYAEDIGRLQELTARNLDRLKEHTTLPFGPKPTDAVHIPRTEELSALIAAAKSGHSLLTGEPGCGKSGLIHRLVEELQKERFPVVLLLAEEVFGPDATASANPSGLNHDFDDVLGNWPNGGRGFLITDALDAVRDMEAQKRLRCLLRDVQRGRSGWTVIASVREFDLKFGRELRESFPGAGVAGHAKDDFAGVAHFHLTRLSEPQLDSLAARRKEIRPFIERARKNARSEGIHRSPFYLRLAAELLSAGVTPERLADWNSPAVLLRRFWEARVTQGAGSAQRQVALRTICRQMVDTRSMTVSLNQLIPDVQALDSVSELRSRGILQAPVLRHGTLVGGDEIRFTHHLLHDYAIARCLIPEPPAPFYDFAARDPFLPVFYRQSFLFALEEIWDGPNGREGFWESALRLEGTAKMYGLTRILAPVIAARRVETLPDLQPLLAAAGSAGDIGSPGQKALLHLASALQDVGADLIRTGAAGWCAFVEQLAGQLPAKPFTEWPLVHILARLNAVNAANDAPQRLALNVAGRRLLAHHVSQNVAKERQYPGRTAIETICRTFTTAPAESEHALLSLLAPERLEKFPHLDLHDLADNLRHLGSGGDAVVLGLFKAAFAAGPARGQYEATGSRIMSMSFQTSDQWNMVHYALAGYYEARNGENAALMTEAACIAWNAIVRRRVGRRGGADHILATIRFRGAVCDLIEDYSHIWGRGFEREENRILSHFEKLLRGWAAAGDTARLNAALDRLAVCNRTSVMWGGVLEAGVQNPSALGPLLQGVLNEPVFLTHPDYAYAGTALLASLHKAGDATQRERLERLILDLPRNVRLENEADRNPTPSWVEYAQNRLLGALEEPNIVLGTVRDLRRDRQTAEPLPVNRKPEQPSVRFGGLSTEQEFDRRGINPKTPANQEMLRLREALKPFLDLHNKRAIIEEIEGHWPVIPQCEVALERYSEQESVMAQELWGHLVGASEKIVGYVTSWPRSDERWQTIRRILLKAASDPVPEADDQDAKDEDRPSWGWPAPRLDAACGLPCLAYCLGHADNDVTAALRRLCRDKSCPLRFNLAERLAVLEEPSPELMWELIDTFIADETMFSVLDALVLALDQLWESSPEQVKPRLRQIADRAIHGASGGRRIHETLAHTNLFQFLGTGEPECGAFIAKLIAECDGQQASHALATVLHECRAGGWLTAGDGVKQDAYGDEVRARTWGFFARLLTSAQAKLQQHREAWDQLHKPGQPDQGAVEDVQEKIERTLLLVDGVAAQLLFACGALHEGTSNGKGALTPAQLDRFWKEAAPLFSALVAEPHPHTADQIVQTLHHLLPCSPSEVFLLAAKSIRNSAKQAGFQFEPLAVGNVVNLIQRALADHREIFRSEPGQESEGLKALLEVLDLFVEAGWAEARQLTNQLEEINR